MRKRLDQIHLIQPFLLSADRSGRRNGYWTGPSSG